MCLKMSRIAGVTNFQYPKPPDHVKAATHSIVHTLAFHSRKVSVVEVTPEREQSVEVRADHESKECRHEFVDLQSSLLRSCLGIESSQRQGTSSKEQVLRMESAREGARGLRYQKTRGSGKNNAM